jgi:hypothetical protein
MDVSGTPGPLETPTAVRFRVALTAVTVVAVVLALVVRVVDAATARGAAASSVTVDFTKTIATVPATDIGATISGYGGDTTVASSEVHQKLLKSLGLGLLRIELRYSEPGKPESKVVCNSWAATRTSVGPTGSRGSRPSVPSPSWCCPPTPTTRSRPT